MGYYISEVGYYLPERIIDNEFLATRCGIDMAFLENRVGIKERHVAADDEPPSAMACRSATTLFDTSGIAPHEVDILMVCTQNPDYRLPTTACLVQDMLGLKKSCFSFDINLGCSAFVYALPIAGNFLQLGMARHALIITVDEYSKIIDFRDKNTAALFGDAAAATLLSPCEDGFGVIDGIFGTDGSGAPHLILYNSGLKKDPGKSPYLYMDGREIFRFAVTVVPDSVDQLLARNNIKTGDVRHYVFHQANLFMLREIQKRLSLKDYQMVIDMVHYGNTVSASIPIAYKNLITASRPSRGDLVVFCGFGVGLSWGTVLYRCS